MGYTKKETDFWGNEKEVHYDDTGKKVGETRYRETLFGNKVQDHYNTDGQKVGETRREEGFFADKAVHYNSDGEKIGYTKDDTTFFGDKIQRHYDPEGKEVGKSHYEDGLFSGRRKVHEREYFKGNESNEGSRVESDAEDSSASANRSSSRSDYGAPSSGASPSFVGTAFLILALVAGSAYFIQGRPDRTQSPAHTTSPKGGVASHSARSAVPQRLLPIDEAGKDLGFLQFRRALLEAIDRRDANSLLWVVHKDIKLSFGDDWGLHRFIEIWDPYSPDSAIWRELGDVLRQGGTFGYKNYPKDTFWAPYVFGAFPDQLDAFSYTAIVGRDVQVRVRPLSTSPVIATISYELVALGPYDPNPMEEKIGEFSYPWKQVRLADGRTGYVYGRYVRSPIDYRAAFNKVGGAWKLTLFLRGD